MYLLVGSTSLSANQPPPLTDALSLAAETPTYFFITLQITQTHISASNQPVAVATADCRGLSSLRFFVFVVVLNFLR